MKKKIKEEEGKSLKWCLAHSPQSMNLVAIIIVIVIVVVVIITIAATVYVGFTRYRTESWFHEQIAVGRASS